ncbi:FG-GAP repeat domain-containing protein [Lentzea sp. HUAS TT2]|uniref:FG-GAP repeat domain-containing protein n=1 Tax=Lentzea sp. HUAS TT2 TaxID=3447454 RepID=UPI003F72DDC3
MISSLVAVAPSAGASVMGGVVSRAESLARAQNWVDRGITYTQSAAATDPDGAHSYRRDCSGLVSMAWHLPSSLLTNEFLAKAQAGDGITIIAKSALRSGDAMVRDSDGWGRDGHMELFSHWKNPNNHSEGAYVYSFNKQGETVRNPRADNNVGERGFNSNSEMNEYTFIRYKKMGGERVSDFSGDGYADLLAVNAAGDLVYYPNNNLTISDSTSRRIGQGWGTFSHVAAGDFSGDGFADVLGVNAAGNLMYYPNNGIAIADSTSRQLASGWGSFRHVMAADFSGDGYADVLAVNAAGDLVYYPNNNLTISESTSRRIGQGWDTFSHVFAADFSGDGHADVLGVNSAGNLMYYPNNGLAISDGTARRIGQGWGTFRHVFASDFSGDGHADVLGVDGSGAVLYYPNNNLSLSGSSQLATGWQAFRHAL